MQNREGTLEMSKGEQNRTSFSQQSGRKAEHKRADGSRMNENKTNTSLCRAKDVDVAG